MEQAVFLVSPYADADGERPVRKVFILEYQLTAFEKEGTFSGIVGIIQGETAVQIEEAYLEKRLTDIRQQVLILAEKGDSSICFLQGQPVTGLAFQLDRFLFIRHAARDGKQEEAEASSE